MKMAHRLPKMDENSRGRYCSSLYTAVCKKTPRFLFLLESTVFWATFC